MFFSVGRNLERDCDDDATGFIPYLVEFGICHRLGQKMLIRPLGLPPVRRSDQSYVCINFEKMECIVWRIPESCLFFPAAKTLHGEK